MSGISISIYTLTAVEFTYIFPSFFFLTTVHEPLTIAEISGPGTSAPERHHCLINWVYTAGVMLHAL